MERDHALLAQAVHNNAVWCDTICQLQSGPGIFTRTLWIHSDQAPLYYPNLITLTPDAQLPSRQEKVGAWLREQQGYPVSVKDSFANLDLTNAGFQQLFQAWWLLRPTPGRLVARDSRRTIGADRACSPSPASWRPVTTEQELLLWEKAWAGGATPSRRTFLPPLLASTEIAIIAAWQGEQIIAGAIASRTAQVVGISNIFAPEQGARDYWTGMLSLLEELYPALPLVGYEQADSVQTALDVGFTILGPLRVWSKEAK